MTGRRVKKKEPSNVTVNRGNTLHVRHCPACTGEHSHAFLQRNMLTAEPFYACPVTGKQVTVKLGR